MGALEHLRSTVVTPIAGLRFSFNRIEAGRGRGQRQGEPTVVIECSTKVTGRPCAAACPASWPVVRA
eukprot:12667242-Alexandrium_andersonii.AAC.1